MNKIVTFAVALLVGVFAASAAEGWLVDLDKGLAQAQKEKKPVLIDFTGSDWCGWCIKLDNEVFDKKEFKEYAKKHVVLVKVDFPRGTGQSDEQRKTNNDLAKKYGIGGFPTIVILDSAGKRIGTMGYQAGGPKAFIESFKKILQDADK